MSITNAKFIIFNFINIFIFQLQVKINITDSMTLYNIKEKQKVNI